jgi:putative ABC transport system substrate-binding protein
LAHVLAARQMRRRSFLLLVGGSSAVWPLGAAAQDKRRPRLAIFASVLPETEMSETRDPAYRIIFEELRRRGYEEGRTIDVDRWSARGDVARFPELAREIVRSKPDIIYTGPNLGQVQALLKVTTTVPIVAQGADLVASGLADSFSRPGRNVTGLSGTFSALQLDLKHLQLLRDVAPTASRIAWLLRRSFWEEADHARQLREAASRMGVTLVRAMLDDPFQPADYRRAFTAMPDQRIDAVCTGNAVYNYGNRDLIVDLAAEGRLPTITGWRVATERGGPMSYGPDFAWGGLTIADFIVRVLQGEKPADIPLRSADKFELVINLKTARVLGITIPPAVLLRADEVIE